MKTLMTIVAILFATQAFAYNAQKNGNVPENIMNEIVTIAKNCHYNVYELETGEICLSIPGANEGETDLFFIKSNDKEITFESVRCDISILYDSVSMFLESYINSIYAEAHLTDEYVPDWFLSKYKNKARV